MVIFELIYKFLFEECDEDQFSCPVDDSGRFACVDFEHICDSVPDCPNGEDEIFCG